MKPRISLSLIHATNFNIADMIYVILFCLCIQLAENGRPSEERLLMRLLDQPDQYLSYFDQPLADDDELSGNRSRRQLPTEISIQVTAPLFTARLYDFGSNDGDKEVPPSIDVGIKFELKHPITFYDQKYTEIYILSNGGIGFEPNSRNYKADILKSGPQLIAPLWNRNDLRKGGKIFYREVSEGRPIERAQSEVRYQLDKNIKPISVLLITWVHMQPMGEQNLSEENSNTFQAAIITSDNGTFANLIYKNIGWTQGAEAGFSKGDGKNFYALPTSGTSNIMYIKENGNTGIPGEWMFEIGQQKVIRCKPGVKGDTCDEECADFEWGNDCDKCCHCAKGRCDKNTGQCPGECKQCWKNAPHCDKRDSECRVKPKECGYNAISFTDYDRCGEAIVRCQCLSGYIGDGFNCTDVDECAKPNTCSPFANCYNTPGRFYCECQNGFSGNGTVCTASDSANRNGGGGISIVNAINRTLITSISASSAAPVLTSVALLTAAPPRATTDNTTIATLAASTVPSSSITTFLSTSTNRLTTSSALLSTSTPLRNVATNIDSITASTSTAPTSVVLIPVVTNAPQTIITAESIIGPTTKTQYPDAIQTLPKETYSQINYRLRQPLNVFGKKRDHLTISSTGLIALDDVPAVTPEDDLDQLGITGFAPFFGKIDLGQHGLGAVTVRETSHSYVLTEATSLVDTYFHAPGFIAKSVVTITFDNVTTAGKQQKNNFQVILVGGNNALGENVTYVEYIYSNLQWGDGAQAMILTDNAADSVQLPGSGSEGVRQLSQLSNIDEPGHWMYRVDLDRVTCPQSNLLPPYCNSDTPAPTSIHKTSIINSTSHAASTASTASSSSSTTTIGLVTSDQTINIFDAGLRVTKIRTFDVTPVHPVADFEDETVTFPAFITVVPQILTHASAHATVSSKSGTTSPIPPPNTAAAAASLKVTETTTAGTARPPALVEIVPNIPVVATVGPHPPSIITGDIQAPGFDPEPPAVPAPIPQPPSAKGIQTHTVPVTEPIPIIVNSSAQLRPVGPPVTASTLGNTPQPTPSQNVSSQVTILTTGPTLTNTSTVSHPQPEPEPTPTSNAPIIKPLNITSGTQQPSQPNDSHVLVPNVEFGIATNPPSANGNDESAGASLPPLQIFTTPRRQPRPPVPTRPGPRIVTATSGSRQNEFAGPRRPPPNIDNNINTLQNNIIGESDELDSLNSPSKLAIIIPTAIVGVWLLLLMLIGVVVCCKRRNSRRRMRNKFDAAYFRHMPSIAAARGKDTAAVATAAASSSVPQTSGVYGQQHVTYEDHLEKAARLSEMSQYGQNGGRVSMYGSYWNVPNNSRQYSYYNQGYYESCPEFNRTSYYNGRY